jgi:hypothetical protein
VQLSGLGTNSQQPHIGKLRVCMIQTSSKKLLNTPLECSQEVSFLFWLAYRQIHAHRSCRRCPTRSVPTKPSLSRSVFFLLASSKILIPSLGCSRPTFGAARCRTRAHRHVGPEIPPDRPPTQNHLYFGQSLPYLPQITPSLGCSREGVQVFWAARCRTRARHPRRCRLPAGSLVSWSALALFTSNKILTAYLGCYLEDVQVFGAARGPTRARHPRRA